MRAINTILFDVLGWDRLSVDFEKYCREVGYADYAFFQDEHLCLILEAKKAGETFVLGDRSYPERPVGFALLAKECPAAGAAMIQAAGYAAAQGSRYIAISNGSQWILALAFVDNQPVEERSVYVFESFQAIDDKFSRFWRCLSPEAIYANTPATSLLESRKAPAPAKLATRVTNYPAPADRNVIVNELAYVIEIVWDETNSHDDDEYFLGKCYVTSEASQSNITLAKELVEHRFRMDELYGAQAVQTQNIRSVFENAPPEKPIVILGGIGHGKSTFLKHFRHIAAKDALKQYIQLDVNFSDWPDSPSDVGRYIFREIDQQLHSLYGVDINEDSFVRAALRSPLQRFRKTPQAKGCEGDEAGYRRAEIDFINSIQKDQHDYLKHVFQHLKQARRNSVAVFLDNLDRRDDPIQEELFFGPQQCRAIGHA